MKLKTLTYFFLIGISIFLSSADASDCASQKFISAAGVNLRSEAKQESTLVKVLRFNTPVCVAKKNADWLEIVVGEHKGWIPKDLVSDHPTSAKDAVAKATEAKAKNDLKTAVTWGQRAAEAEESVENYQFLQKLYYEMGATRQGNLINDRIRELALGKGSTPTSQSTDVVQIAVVGGGTKLDLNLNQPWLGARCKNGKCDLVNAGLKLTKFKGTTGNSDPIETEIEQIIPPEEFKFVISGLPKSPKTIDDLKASYLTMTTLPAADSKSLNRRSLEKRQQYKATIMFKGKKVVVEWLRYIPNCAGSFCQLVGPENEFYISDGTLRKHILDVSRSPVVESLGDNSQWILWAGDLDGDDRLDLIVNTGCDGGFYLSKLGNGTVQEGEVYNPEYSGDKCQ